MTMQQETIYAMALARICNFSFAAAQAIYRKAGSAANVYAARNDINDIMPECTPRFAKALKEWDEPLRRAETEAEFARKNGISVLAPDDARYPRRLCECDDSPIVLYYKGCADLNATRVVSIVGTRKCTAYGQDLIAAFARDLRGLCPDVLVVSGLAYGVDIHAHRAALHSGYPTVGVLAHGLDRIYPPRHRDTAVQMLGHGGLLTEFMSGTNADKVNFVKRNRIVAGMADATIVVESAGKGGALITAGIARSYNRDVFAFPGAVGAPYSAGCNKLIRDNSAALITCAADFVEAMGWTDDTAVARARHEGIERPLFPEFTADEQRVVQLLADTNDLQHSIIAVKTGMPAGKLAALLFGLEMKGVVKPLAGGAYHLMGF